MPRATPKSVCVCVCMYFPRQASADLGTRSGTQGFTKHQVLTPSAPLPNKHDTHTPMDEYQSDTERIHFYPDSYTEYLEWLMNLENVSDSIF